MPKTSAPAWRRYLRFWGSNIADDVDDELRFHVDMRAKEYIARGMPESAAREAALARLGGIDAARIQCVAIGKEKERLTRQADLFDSLTSDVRFALRSLARSPAWTIVALLTIALGIGASTAVFSVVDRLLVRPVTYPGARRLFAVERLITLGGNQALMNPSGAAVRTWRRFARSIEAVEGYGRRDLLTSPGETDGQPIHAALIDTSFLTFAGMRPLVGRTFSSDETVPNGPAVAILSEGYWRREFGADRNVVGQLLRTNGGSFTIVGVLPASLQLPDLGADSPDVWLPLVGGSEQRLAFVIARLKPGVAASTARDELEAIAARSSIDVAPLSTSSVLRLSRPGDTLRFGRVLWMLAGAVALLLLVASANVAHLLLARGKARERELAVRYALGAGRARLVRQLLTESLVLSALGGAAALLVGQGALRLVRALHPANLNALAHVSANRDVILIAAALTVVTGVGVGLLVGLRTARRGLGETLRVGGSGTARGGRRLRSSLVVTEIGLSATLLIGALLLVRGVMALESADLGFNARNLYGVRFSLRGGQFSSAPQRAAFARDLLARGRTLAGVQAVTLAATVPPNGGWLFAALETSERVGSPSEPNTVSANEIAPDYLSVMEIPLAGGRPFDLNSAANNEVIINERLAHQLWPGQSALGRRFRAGQVPGDAGPAPWWTVVGITTDAFTHGLSGEREAAMYTPLGNLADGHVTLIARARSGADIGPALRRLASALQPGAPAPSVGGVEDALTLSLAEPRFSMIVLATFAAMAVVLAAIGLYGVISYTVAQRTREIGVRMTLGATRGMIARLVVGDGIRLSAIGVALGLAGGRAMTQVIQSALDGVKPQDPLSFAIGAAVLIAISALACVIPMLRATGVDPVVAMRVD